MFDSGQMESWRWEQISTASASNEKRDMGSGKSEVRNGKVGKLFSISHMASEKWEVGLKGEFPFLKYPPLEYFSESETRYFRQLW